MPGPGFPVANKILYKYEQDRAYRLHRQKVRIRVGGGVMGRGYRSQVPFIDPLLCWKNLQPVVE